MRLQFEAAEDDELEDVNEDHGDEEEDDGEVGEDEHYDIDWEDGDAGEDANNDGDENNGEEDEDEGPVEGPIAHNIVSLARCPGMFGCPLYFPSLIVLYCHSSPATIDSAGSE